MDTVTVRLEGTRLNIRALHERLRDLMAEFGAGVVDERRLMTGASVITFGRPRQEAAGSRPCA